MTSTSTPAAPPSATSDPLPTGADIAAAARRISGVVARTPLERSDRLSALTGATVYLKREDQQRVRSYKLRGAYNLMAQLGPVERESGVVCASAGNHAQGVAYACRALGIDGTIYLPRTTPRQKRDRIRAHGGDQVELIMVGDTFDDAAEAAARHAGRTGAVPVPPFDDARTVAGQGTVAVEILEQLGAAPDVLVVPVGGAGLIAGVATALADHPQVRLVGAEPTGAASLTAALAAGRPVRLDHIDPFVDGAAVRQIGALPFAVLQRRPLEVIAVDEGAICTEMLGLYQNEGIIAEPAGALSVAALRAVRPRPGQTVVCLVSGGNNDVSRYGEVLERSLVHAGLKHYFLVDFPQEPGALRRFLDEVLGPDDDITLFEYVKRNNRETGPALVGIELGAPEGLPGLLERMASGPMQVERIDPGSPAYRFLT
ncbi:threonine ammonia-lyase IlvA [Nakamurella sp. YIM 132087]|uniref:L-threonine dehydratase n=1 Tax=Nakamurella alba TaxID=2665158 RepID=A0A7K1FNV5_9ACTN|nr:threonine ammonia-lyase IlvA [Nakamurella alba]MTD15826.1 threonine ammonia-lyase IlvA [Nakamurella alba]